MGTEKKTQVGTEKLYRLCIGLKIKVEKLNKSWHILASADDDVDDVGEGDDEHENHKSFEKIKNGVVGKM